MNDLDVPVVKTCPRCGAKLSGDGPAGSCPACLLTFAIGIGLGACNQAIEVVEFKQRDVAERIGLGYDVADSVEGRV